MPLCHRLCHLKLNVVPYFSFVKDSQNYLAVELQSRQTSPSTSLLGELPSYFPLSIRSESYGMF
jgi:hypothetical protein